MELDVNGYGGCGWEERRMTLAVSRLDIYIAPMGEEVGERFIYLQAGA